MDDEDDQIIGRPLRVPLSNTSNPRDKEPEVDEVTLVLKWQEDRLKRKMQGEYESAIIRIAELVNGNLDASSRISAVRVLGAVSTRDSFLKTLIAPHLGPQKTFGDVMHSTRRIVDSLARSDIFTDLRPTLALAASPLAREGDLDLILNAKERGRFFFKSSTELGNGEGSASATARIRNVFGGAETLEGSISFGTKTRHSFTASFAAPLAATDLRSRLELAAFGYHRDNESWASSSEELEGIKASFRHDIGFSSHELAYEIANRRVCGLTAAASLSMREQARDTIKSSISHAFVYDSRIESSSGRLGAYLKISEELAGTVLRGDASHFKTEVTSQFSRVMFPGLTASIGLRGGLLYALSGRQSIFSDRFQLGGPLTMRSLRWSGLGPHDGPDSLGGDLYWAAGLSLIGDIPRREHWPLKTHVFLNAGRLDQLNLGHSSLQDHIRSSLTAPTVTAGVGILFNHGIARAEINVGVPLVASQSDKIVRGMQFGVGIDFL